METTRTKRKIQIWLCLILCFACNLGAHCQRPIKVRLAASHLLIAEAENHIGIREATGNNDGIWVERYLKSTGLGKGYPWCAAFQSYIHKQTCMGGPQSARVVDWFKNKVVYRKEWGELPNFYSTTGMVGALYYRKLGRLGHIFLIVGEDKNNFYTIEANTNVAGSREGDGVYRKIRSKKSVAALADYCIDGNLFIVTYDNFIPNTQKH